MNVLQMFVVLAAVSFGVYLTLPLYGVEVTFMQAFVAMAGLKAIALFLVPEKAPMVFVKSREEIEEED